MYPPVSFTSGLEIRIILLNQGGVHMALVQEEQGIMPWKIKDYVSVCVCSLANGGLQIWP